MALTDLGECNFCGKNCERCSANGGSCAECTPGYSLINQVCTPPLPRFGLKAQLDLITDIQLKSAGLFCTQQELTVNLSPDVHSLISLDLIWILFARDIASSYQNCTCDELYSALASNSSALHSFPRSVARFGANNLNLTGLSSTPSPYIDQIFSSLRANTLYNFTICMRDRGLKDAMDWDSSSAEFTTKDNGYSVGKVRIELDASLAETEYNGFLCKLVEFVGISMDKISTSEGVFCTKGRRLQSDDQSRRLLQISSNYVDLLIYGDPLLEGIDTSVTSTVAILESSGFMLNFFYQDSSARIVHVESVVYGGKIYLNAPYFSSSQASTQLIQSDLLVSNISVDGTDGYLYLHLLPYNGSDSYNFTLSLEMNSLPETLPSGGLTVKHSFSINESSVYKIPNVSSSVTYLLFLTATNEDVSQYALRTPTLMFLIPAPDGEVNASHKLTSGALIGLEIAAIAIIIVIWLLIFKGESLKKLTVFRRKRRRNSQKPRDKVASIIVSKDDPENIQLGCSHRAKEDSANKTELTIPLPLINPKSDNGEILKSPLSQFSPISFIEAQRPKTGDIERSQSANDKLHLGIENSSVLNNDSNLSLIPSRRQKTDRELDNTFQDVIHNVVYGTIQKKQMPEATGPKDRPDEKIQILGSQEIEIAQPTFHQGRSPGGANSSDSSIEMGHDESMKVEKHEESMNDGNKGDSMNIDNY